MRRKRVLQAVGQSPLSRRDLFGEAETPQFLQAAGAQGLLEGVAVAGPDQAVALDVAQQAAIKAGQAFLLHLAPQPILDLQIGARPQVEGDQFRRPLAQTHCQVVAGDDQILALVVLAAEDDVAVRMAGVEVIDRHPIQPGAQVLLHLRHQAAGQRLQLVVLGPLLRRDDEAELMAVAIGAVEEGLAVGAILLGAIELARLSIAGHAVALDIAQMGLRPFHAVARQLDDAGFDDDTAAAKGGMAVARGQHPANAGAAPDLAAVEFVNCRRSAARRRPRRLARST